MSEIHQFQAPAAAPAADRRSDGKDGAAMPAPAPRIMLQKDGDPAPMQAPPPNTPGKPNAALKEAATWKDGDGVNPNHPARGRCEIVDADRAIVRETAPDGSRRRKIAICGFASSTRKYMPMPEPDWSIWGLNQLYRHIPRADRWFDIHYNWDQEVVPGTDHRGWCRDAGIPVYLMARQPDLPTSVRYPIDVIIKHFQADYFTSTIAYMMALAIWEIDQAAAAEMKERLRGMSVEEFDRCNLKQELENIYDRYSIGLFGIDLTVEDEYFHEKPCAEYWIGQASGRGIQVRIPRESALCKQRYRYGYDRDPESLIKIAELKKHQADLESERMDLLKKMCMIEGAIQCDQRWTEWALLRERGTEVQG